MIYVQKMKKMKVLLLSNFLRLKVCCICFERWRLCRLPTFLGLSFRCRCLMGVLILPRRKVSLLLHFCFLVKCPPMMVCCFHYLLHASLRRLGEDLDLCLLRLDDEVAACLDLGCMEDKQDNMDIKERNNMDYNNKGSTTSRNTNCNRMNMCMDNHS